MKLPVRVEDEEACCEIGEVEHAGIQAHLMEQLHDEHSIGSFLFFFRMNINYLAYYHSYQWEDVQHTHEIEVRNQVLSTDKENIILWRIACCSNFIKGVVETCGVSQ